MQAALEVFAVWRSNSAQVFSSTLPKFACESSSETAPHDEWVVDSYETGVKLQLLNKLCEVQAKELSNCQLAPERDFD